MLNVGDIVTIKTLDEIVVECGSPFGKSERLSYMSGMCKYAGRCEYQVETSSDLCGESRVKLRSIVDGGDAGGYWYDEYMLKLSQITTYETFSESDIKALFGA